MKSCQRLNYTKALIPLEWYDTGRVSTSMFPLPKEASQKRLTIIYHFDNPSWLLGPSEWSAQQKIGQNPAVCGLRNILQSCLLQQYVAFSHEHLLPFLIFDDGNGPTFSFIHPINDL